MLTPRLLALASFAAFAAIPPATAQELQPHRAAYAVSALEHGKPVPSTPGTYAFELKATCEAYVISQLMRLEVEGARGAIVSEQQSLMTESRDGKRLKFEHRSLANGRTLSEYKGEASLAGDGGGQARFSEPEGQTVALPAGTLFPLAIARETLRQAKVGATGFDALFFFGEKPKPPQAVNVVLGRVPKRLADLRIPEGAEALAEGRGRVYYRGAFFDAQAKGQGEQAAFEMSSLMLDNGIELYGTHEEGESGIQYRITRLEPLPKPACN